MEFKKSKNSIVILANLHNPTVFWGDFLLSSGIVENEAEIRKDSSIITPAFAKVLFKKGDSIQVDPERLKIEGNFGETSFLRGVSYINALPHIVCKAIGINFTYEIKGFNFKNFVTWKEKDKYMPTGVSLLFESESIYKGIVSFNFNIEKQITLANFNFDYRFDNTKFANIPIDILEERNNNIEKAEEVLNELLA